MLSRFAPIVARTAARSTSLAAPACVRAFSDVVTTAGEAAKLSGYSNIEFRINEESMVIDAVQQFAANNIGCLVTVNESGDLTGIISERDYISKIALLGRTSKETKVKEIATTSAKLVTVKPDDTVQACMEKMLASDIRHLPLVENGELLGMLSIKDLVKTTIKEKEETIKVLSDFALGKGGHYGSD
jgi:signal-transduction protein with cAMP-binding, CBS, and nucleotidyltransferase domain